MIAHRLLDEAERRDCAPSLLKEVQQLYIQLTEKMTTRYALRILQNICNHLCKDQETHLVFVFDQFEDVWQNLDARFFVNLRYLRDQFKYQIVYLVITRDRLSQMRRDAHAVEAFWELFSAHTYGLGPYSERDASLMVKQLAARAGVVIDTTMVSIILQLSGCHPGMLRAVFWANYNAQWKALSVSTALQSTSIIDECKKIWESLLPVEQHVIQLIVQSEMVPQTLADSIADLRLKGVINDEPSSLFSPIFFAYIQSMPENRQVGVSVDIHRRQVWLDGHLLQQPLSPLEFKLLEYLARHGGEVCQYADLMRELYNDKGQTRNDQRFYAVLARLRKVLGENAHHPRYLVTHHGGGVQLVKGDIRNGEEK